MYYIRKLLYPDDDEPPPILNESHISPSRSILYESIFIEEDDYMKFKLYENVKSLPIPQEELRCRFSNYMDYLLHCFSLTGSLSNLIRFPYLAYNYYGCSFLVQFLILVVLIGVPWCFMETAIGQYSGRGPTAIGDMVPIGKGVAIAMGYICFLNVIGYSPIQSRCLLYMYRSISEQILPWKHCSVSNYSECLDENGNLDKFNSKSVGIELHEPSESYYLEKIVDVDKSVLYDGLGKFNIALLCCLAISWIINFFLLVASNKFMKYVQIFGSIAPFILIFTMLVVVLMTSHNALEDFSTLFDTSTIDLLNLQSWVRAAEQVLYSLDVGTGHLIIYGQHRGFRNNILNDILIVTLLNIICAVSATLVIFGTANKMACKLHINIQSVFNSGSGLFFISVSAAMAQLPFPRLSSFLAFFVLFVICIITQLSFLKPIVYSLDAYITQYELLRSYYCAGIICAITFGLSLVTVTKAGEIVISMLEDIGSTMGILIITTFEAILIFGIYGISEFCADLAFMTDQSPSTILKILFIAGPVFTINIMLACGFYWIPPQYLNIPYPTKIYVITWIMPVLTLFIILGSAIYTIVQFTRNGNFFGAFESTNRWVPDLIYSLKNDQLRSMTDLREKLTYDSTNNLTFGIGKPRLLMKVDQATQMEIEKENDTPLDNDNVNDIISNQRLQHFYLEVSSNISNKFELIRKHNENVVIGWDDVGLMEHHFEKGVIEKYVQTD